MTSSFNIIRNHMKSLKLIATLSIVLAGLIMVILGCGKSGGGDDASTPECPNGTHLVDGECILLCAGKTVYNPETGRCEAVTTTTIHDESSTTTTVESGTTTSSIFSTTTIATSSSTTSASTTTTTSTPCDVSGVWHVNWNGFKGTMTLTQSGNSFNGIYNITDDGGYISAGTVSEYSITFHRDNVSQDFTGTISTDCLSISGTFYHLEEPALIYNWSAWR